MANPIDVTNLPDGNSYDAFMSRAPNGVQIGQDPPLFNPYSLPITDTSSSTTSSTTDPYITYLNSLVGPSYQSLTANGNAAQVPIKAGANVGDYWVQTFIKSINWRSKAQGFWIDGLRGYAEFANVFISGEIIASSGEIGGFIIDINL